MLTKDQIAIIKDYQQVSIFKRQLVKEQLDLAYSENWFNIWVPKEIGGKELSLPEGLSLLEELAYYDAGLAWTVTLCSGANMFAGFIDPSFALAIWRDSKICLGGSGMIGGKAEWDGSTYTISGFWKYATGAPHLTYFTLNAEIWQNGEQLFNEDGTALIKSFLVHKDRVLIQYDWNSFGLEATASHSFSVEGIKVAKEHSFEIKPEKRTFDLPLYDIAFLPFAELTLWVNYCGMYRRFLDLLEKYFFESSKNPIKSKIDFKKLFKELDAKNSSFQQSYELIISMANDLWNQTSDTSQIAHKEVLHAQIAESTRNMLIEMKKNMTQLFTYGGIRACQHDNEMNIVFRNFFTATQHSLLNNI